jgi:hypothetical protein
MSDIGKIDPKTATTAAIVSGRLDAGAMVLLKEGSAPGKGRSTIGAAQSALLDIVYKKGDVAADFNLRLGIDEEYRKAPDSMTSGSSPDIIACAGADLYYTLPPKIIHVHGAFEAGIVPPIGSALHPQSGATGEAGFRLGHLRQDWGRSWFFGMEAGARGGAYSAMDKDRLGVRTEYAGGIGIMQEGGYRISLPSDLTMTLGAELAMQYSYRQGTGAIALFNMIIEKPIGQHTYEPDADEGTEEE